MLLPIPHRHNDVAAETVKSAEASG
jgi:hypothetical protein